MFFIRRILEKFSRGKVIKRKLPKDFGSLPIYVSPDSQLKYIKPINKYSAFDEELLYVVKNYIKRNSVVWDIGANIGVFTFASSYKTGKGGKFWL